MCGCFQGSFSREGEWGLREVSRRCKDLHGHAFLGGKWGSPGGEEPWPDSCLSLSKALQASPCPHHTLTYRTSHTSDCGDHDLPSQPRTTVTYTLRRRGPGAKCSRSRFSRVWRVTATSLSNSASRSSQEGMCPGSAGVPSQQRRAGLGPLLVLVVHETSERVATPRFRSSLGHRGRESSRLFSPQAGAGPNDPSGRSVHQQLLRGPARTFGQLIN